MTGAIATTRETRIIVTLDGVGKLSQEDRVTRRGGPAGGDLATAAGNKG